MLINRLQKMQNKSARLVSRPKLHEHITHVIEELHWLPVKYMIQFKILYFAYKCKHDITPYYPTDILSSYRPSGTLRSSISNNFEIPSIHSTFGCKVFFLSTLILCGIVYYLTLSVCQLWMSLREP